MKTTGPVRKSGLLQLGSYLGIGLEFAVTLLLFILLGHYLDGRWGTEPWLTLAGSVAGFVTAFVNLFFTLSKLMKKNSERKGEG